MPKNKKSLGLSLQALEDVRLSVIEEMKTMDDTVNLDNFTDTAKWLCEFENLIEKYSYMSQKFKLIGQG